MLLGALLGALGSAGGKAIDYFQRKQDIEAEAARRKDEIEIAKITGASQEAIARMNSDAEVRKAAYENEAAIGQGSLWVVNVLKLMRPAITLYALTLETIIWFTISSPDFQELLGITTAREIQLLLVTGVIETASMAVAWWFGDRYKRREA